MYSKLMDTSPKSHEICGVRCTAEILGDKWTPQLLKQLGQTESLRFCQLQDTVGGINPRTLSARLTHLEVAGVITRATQAASRRSEYRLTAKGSELLPIIHQMEAWGLRYADV